MEPKGSQREPKGSQRGAKSEPNDNQNASTNRSSEKVAKREPKRHAAGLFLGAIWEPFSIKNEIKIYAKICVEKVMKTNEKNDTKMKLVFDTFRKNVFVEKRVFRKRCMYGKHMNPAVECLPARARPKNTNRENETKLKKNIQK